MIEQVIPKDFINQWGNDDQRERVEAGADIEWFDKYVFQLGNELKHLSYVKHILGQLNGKGIQNDEFTLNFVPGYIRKMTHYAIMNIIIDIFSNAVVIVINGEGTNECVLDEATKLPKITKIRHLNEPSEQVKGIIDKYPDRPVFITGFHCIGMSVTLINEDIGNFDNVIFSHEQYNKTPDHQYQLCRFLFNYINWKHPENIKKTKIYTNSKQCLENCLEYEKQIDIIDSEMKGSIRTKDEVVGKVPVKRTEVPKERMYARLEEFSTVHKLKRFLVSDGDDDEVLDKVKEVYRNFTGKELNGKAMPKKNDKDFYETSITKESKIQTDVQEVKKILSSFNSTSNYQLMRNKYKYARLYVVYDSIDDPSEYNWLIRTMEIQECPEVDEIWEYIEQQKDVKKKKVIELKCVE